MEGLLRWLVGLCSSMYIADSSKKTYADHQGQFVSFCEAFDVDPFTVSELELCLAVGYFAMGHTVSSVPSYLSALQNLYDNNGAGPLPRGPRFHRFHSGLRRLLGTADAVVRTRAITMEDLTRICSSLDPADPVDACFGAQITVAFFLALRTEDHTGGRLRWGDVYPQDDGSLEFLLPPGKSVRTFRHVAIAPRDDVVSPRRWLTALAAAVPSKARELHRPIFVDLATARNGAVMFLPLSRSKFIARFKHAVSTVLGVSPILFAGYSLRRGGVTAMLAAGVPVPAVKRHVGWSPTSEAVNTYYDHTGRVVMRLPTSML
jgi:hypothetical protein